MYPILDHVRLKLFFFLALPENFWYPQHTFVDEMMLPSWNRLKKLGCRKLFNPICSPGAIWDGINLFQQHSDEISKEYLTKEHQS